MQAECADSKCSGHGKQLAPSITMASFRYQFTTSCLKLALVHVERLKTRSRTCMLNAGCLEDNDERLTGHASEMSSARSIHYATEDGAILAQHASCHKDTGVRCQSNSPLHSFRTSESTG